MGKKDKGKKGEDELDDEFNEDEEEIELEEDEYYEE